MDELETDNILCNSMLPLGDDLVRNVLSQFRQFNKESGNLVSEEDKQVVLRNIWQNISEDSQLKTYAISALR